MCGIAGMMHLDQGSVDHYSVLQAAHLMKHRGPDDEGYLLLNTATHEHSLRSGPDTSPQIQQPSINAAVPFIPDLVLAHRRLAIIDVSPGGHEPMTVGDGQLWITFNGEIYNYLELRDELHAQGYRFHTESDVEVLLNAYDAWGLNCLDRFVGMFAFALWDQRRKRLWCVRDRLGIKPFYYSATPEYFAFASEVKALRVLLPTAPDMDQLAWFLHYGGVYNAPRTFFENVNELPGGHYLLIEDGKVGTPMRWWDVDIEHARATYDYHKIEGEFLRLLRDSVALRLRSDVPVGTCLSGGLDSSAIVALATERLNGGRMNSFSAVYPAKGLDETRYVDIVSNRFNTIAHRVTPAPQNFLDQMEKIIWHQDIPTTGPSVYTQNLVMKLAHGNVTVLLDGQGSDELMAGYLSYVVYYLEDLRRRNLGEWMRQQTAFMLGVWPRFNAALNWREFAFRVQRYLAGVPNEPVLTPEFERQATRRLNAVDSVQPRGIDNLNRFLYTTLVRTTIPELLHYEDRNSMAYSIEARVPFLDHRFVEFALAVPGEEKIHGAETKVFMRRALKGILPDSIVDRKDKLGYPTPFGQWLRGPLRSHVDTFLNERVLKRDWYNPQVVRNIWRAHLAGNRNAELMINRLITADIWYEINVRPVETSAKTSAASL